MSTRPGSVSPLTPRATTPLGKLKSGLRPAVPVAQGTLALNWLTLCVQRDWASSVAVQAGSQPTGRRDCSHCVGLSQSALAASQPQEHGWG